MISAIRYEVEIQPPSSMPAPIAPWMSASEALTIWMFSTAMKAPSVAPTTASQVLAGVQGGAAGPVLETLPRVAWSAVIAASSASGRRMARRDPRLGLALGDRGHLGVDGGHRRHARPQQAVEAVIAEHGLDGH